MLRRIPPASQLRASSEQAANYQFQITPNISEHVHKQNTSPNRDWLVVSATRVPGVFPYPEPFPPTGKSRHSPSKRRRSAREVRSRAELNPRAGAEAANRTAGSVAGWTARWTGLLDGRDCQTARLAARLAVAAGPPVAAGSTTGNAPRHLSRPLREARSERTKEVRAQGFPQLVGFSCNWSSFPAIEFPGRPSSPALSPERGGCRDG